MGYRLTTSVGQFYVDCGAFVPNTIERFRRVIVERRAFCPNGVGGGVSNDCSPASKGAGDSYGFTTQVSESKDAWGKATYTLPNGETKKNYSVSLDDPATGARAGLKVGAYESEDNDFRPTATAVTIVTWSATPLAAIATKGLAAEDDYVGKGFGRRVMATVLELAREHDADVVSVFAPSNDTQAVMEKYTADGLFTPIPSSKAVAGDFYTEFTINKDKVPGFLAETKRRLKSAKRAFCPNGPGGGVSNTCSPSNAGGGIADITYVGSKDLAEQSAAAMKIKVDDAARIVGGAGEGSHVTVYGSRNTTTLSVSMHRPLAGVEHGIQCDAVIKNEGTFSKPSIVVDYQLMTVARSIRENPETRHAAGREFYRIMADGVEHAKSLGAAEVRLFAAGSGANSNDFRGYAIWPRMGFDAPLPFNIRQKLPKTLSTAKTLQDLHASREGTKWWRSNGIAMDMKLDLSDPSSRQMRTFNRFVKHFVRERRSKDATAGVDGWLSPEDEALIDDMWQEVWNDSRAFCPGASPPDNSCSPANKGTGTVRLRPVLATDTKTAAAAIASDVTSWRQRQAAAGVDMSDAPSQEQIEKNWRRLFMSRSENEGDLAAFTNLNPERKARVANAVESLSQNDEFSKFADIHGYPLVIFRRAEKGNTAQAEFRGAIHVYDKTGGYKGADYPYDRDFSPGVYSAGDYGGYQAMIRHEYGHQLFGSLTRQQQREWSQDVRGIDRGMAARQLTEYSTQNPEEMFCEVFAAATEPSARGRLPDWVVGLHERQREWLLK